MMKLNEWYKKIALAHKFFSLNIPADEGTRVRTAELRQIFDQLLRVAPRLATDSDHQQLESLMNHIEQLHPRLMTRDFLVHRIAIFKNMARLWQKRYWLGNWSSKTRHAIQTIQKIPDGASIQELFHAWKEAVFLQYELKHHGILRTTMHLFKFIMILIMMLTSCGIAYLISFSFHNVPFLSWMLISYFIIPFSMLAQNRIEGIRPIALLTRYLTIIFYWSLFFLPSLFMAIELAKISLNEWQEDITDLLAHSYTIYAVFLLLSVIAWILGIFLIPRKSRFKISFLLLFLGTAMYAANRLLLAHYIPGLKFLHQKFITFPFSLEKAFIFDDIIRIGLSIHVYAIIPLLALFIIFYFAKQISYLKKYSYSIPFFVLLLILTAIAFYTFILAEGSSWSDSNVLFLILLFIIIAGIGYLFIGIKSITTFFIFGLESHNFPSPH